MAYTTDPTDPRLGHGVDDEPVPQNQVYLILSEEERAKGFVRPYRDAYRHVGPQPRFPDRLRDLTPEQREQFGDTYAKYEEYPESEAPLMGRYWTQSELDDNGCRQTTTMSRPLSETYARSPTFYGSTYCATCRKHLPVGHFVWTADNKTVGS